MDTTDSQCPRRAENRRVGWYQCSLEMIYKLDLVSSCFETLLIRKSCYFSRLRNNEKEDKDDFSSLLRENEIMDSQVNQVTVAVGCTIKVVL